MPYLAKLSRDGAAIARDLFTSASRRARARPARKLGLSDETRAQIAIKTFRFYSRARVLAEGSREIDPPEKAGLSEGNPRDSSGESR